MRFSRLFLVLCVLACCRALPLVAQSSWRVVKAHPQQSFPASVPAGNYSGITPMGNHRYAVVSDKSATDGFHVMHVRIDSLTGELLHVAHERFVSTGLPCRDAEGIVYQPRTGWLWISGEADNQVRACRPDGSLTGDVLPLPADFQGLSTLYGLESLAYDSIRHTFYTAPESTLPADGKQATSTNGVANVIRIAAIGEGSDTLRVMLYRMDAPTAHRAAERYAMGVSELTVLPDGLLLVLERELFVPSRKIGAFVQCRLYVVDPREPLAPGEYLSKSLLYEWRTRLNITARSWANYEGMCLGPRLPDGSRVLLLVSDSQDQYAGVLRDWWRTLVIAPAE